MDDDEKEYRAELLEAYEGIAEHIGRSIELVSDSTLGAVTLRKRLAVESEGVTFHTRRIMAADAANHERIMAKYHAALEKHRRRPTQN